MGKVEGTALSAGVSPGFSTWGTPWEKLFIQCFYAGVSLRVYSWGGIFLGVSIGFSTGGTPWEKLFTGSDGFYRGFPRGNHMFPQGGTCFAK